MTMIPEIPTNTRRHSMHLLTGLASLAVTLLAGCGLGRTTATGPNPVHLDLTGSMFGGQQPVVGATIQLYTVGTSGSGSASTPLISATVLTGTRGGFHITGDYSCTNATQVYLVGTGGSAGGGTNTDIALATALGPCSGLTSSTFVSINELTTIAAAYALAPFEGSSYTNIGSSTGFATGLANAFAASNVLVSSGSGLVGAAAPAGITVPVTEINTLGNIIASCINSAGAGAPGCSLLNSVTGAGNTFDATFYIAKHPGATPVINLYILSSGTAPFQPSFASTPNDFTIAVKYTGAELQTPSGIAIDNFGNAFVTSTAGNAVTAAPPLSSSFATTTNTAGGMLSAPRGIAVDTNGYVWLANTGSANVVQLAPLTGGNTSSFSGVTSRTVAYSGGAANAPVSIVTDASGNAYTVSPGSNAITAISGSTVAVSGSLTNASFSNPAAIALSGTGTLAVGTGAGQICTLSTGLGTGSGTPTCTTQGAANAITALGYNTSAASTGYATTTISGSTTSGAYGPSIGSGPYTGGGLTAPSAIAFDSAGLAFIANTGSLSQFNSATALSPATGYGTLNAPTGIAIDESGNVWTANSGDNSLSIFIGLANPTLGPIAANLH